MRFKLMVLATAVSVTLPVATPALAQSEPAAPVKEKKVCRREQVTGSYLGSRPICHTKSEWQRIDGANEEGADKTLDRQRQIQNSRVSPNGQ